MSVASDFAEAKNVHEVDVVLRRYMKAGVVPDSIAKDYWVGKTITGGGHTLEVLVAPDYFAIGTDDDPLWAGKESETFAQEVADEYNAILPSQKLLAELENQADVKIPYVGVKIDGRADYSVGAVLKLRDLVNAAFSKYGVTTTDGKLKIGYRKAYVTRPGLDGGWIAIYGGRWTAAGGRVQPTSGHAHTEPSASNGWSYSDASHGIVLVSRKAKLDGEPVDLVSDVFLSTDPSIYGLVSDEGRFNPTFPNVTGASTIASMSVDRFGSGGGGGGVSEDAGGSGGGTATRPRPSYTSEPSVTEVQKALLAHGYSVGSAGADGKLGPSTTAAIKKFQGENGMAQTGAIDDALRSALGLSSLSASAGGAVSSPVLYGVAGSVVGTIGAALLTVSWPVRIGAGVVGYLLGDFWGKKRIAGGG